MMPLCSFFSPIITEHSSRTGTRHRCSIYCCIELTLGYHVLQSSHCQQGLWPPSESFSAPRAHPPLTSVPYHSISHFHHPALSTMPRLRQRMRCHRSTSCGRPPCQPSTTSSSSSSPSSENSLGRYHVTRSGRGLSIGRGLSHPARGLPSLVSGHLHSTQLRFPFSLNKPTIIATITI